MNREQNEGNINSQAQPMPPKMREILTKFEEIFASISIKNYAKKVHSVTESNFKISIVFELAEYLQDTYDFLSEVKIYHNRSLNKLIFQTYLVTKDCLPVCVKDYNTNRLIAKHLLKLNSSLKFGSFSIDPLGAIKFQTLGSYEVNSNNLLNTKEKNLEKWFKINYSTTLTTLKNSLGRILRIAEVITESQYQSSLMISKGKKIPQIFEESQKNILNYIQEYINRIKTANYNKFEQKTADKVKELMAIHENYPEYYTLIIAEKIEYLNKLNSGGYADIHIVKADYVDKNTNEKHKGATLVVKVPKKEGTKSKPTNARALSEQDYVSKLASGPKNEIDSLNVDEDRVRNEREILTAPKSRKFLHIAHYYDDGDRPMLYMDSYLASNLHSFTSKKIHSLQTMWNWTFQLTQYLKFAKDNGIMHLDFKPENVVLAKNYTLKVIDFAESLLKDPVSQVVKSKINISRGHTLPYTAPEALIEPNNSRIESDVFSLAHVIYTILSHKKIFGFKRNSNHKLGQKYKSGTYKTLPFKNFLTSIGPKFMMKYVYFTIMFSLGFSPEMRIQPEDLMLIYQELFTLAEKIF